MIKPKKYKSKKAENLCTWDFEQVKEKIEQCTKDKADHRIKVITSMHNFIASEDKYHPSCYTNFIRPNKTSVSSTSGKCQETDNHKCYVTNVTTNVALGAFKTAVECCFNTIIQDV